MGFGTMLGWSSPSIPFLTSKESKLPITIEEGAWITSVATFGNVIGFLMLPFLVDRVGRKYTLLINATIQIIAWIIIIFSNSFAFLCFGRVVCGIGTSGCVSGMSIYMGEIAEKKIRGMLSIFAVIFSDCGIFVVAAMGAYFSYNTINLVALFVPVLHVITFIFMPESPYFYLMQGRDNEAVEGMMRLRGLKNPKVLQPEIEEIKLGLSEIKNSERNSLKQLFCKGKNLKALAIVSCSVFASLSSGFMAMLAYAQEIFSYSGFSVNPAQSFMILISVKIIADLAATQLIERIGRRFLFLSSGVSCAILLLVVGIFFFCKYRLQADVSLFSWLPLVSLISFQITSALGIGSIPFILMAEFFSIEVKKSAVPCTYIFISFVSFSTELLFPLATGSFGIYVSFWIFATCCFVGTITLFCIQPETKGKSLEEIQLILSRKRK